jgi:hypothetical protein
MMIKDDILRAPTKNRPIVNMTTNEIIKACAEYIGLIIEDHDGTLYFRSWELKWEDYNPLDNDSQAMTLVKRLELCIQPPNIHNTLDFAGYYPSGWHVWLFGAPVAAGVSNNLNHAICECVVNLYLANTDESKHANPS